MCMLLLTIKVSHSYSLVTFLVLSSIESSGSEDALLYNCTLVLLCKMYIQHNIYNRTGAGIGYYILYKVYKIR